MGENNYKKKLDKKETMNLDLQQENTGVRTKKNLSEIDKDGGWK